MTKQDPLPTETSVIEQVPLDTLESELEVTKDGQVLANGQRLR